MRAALLLALALPATLAAQSNRGRNPQNGAGGLFGGGVPGTPQQIIAPQVPVLEGLPHAVKVGFTVYLSAMVPLDSAGQLVGTGDLAAQTRQVMVNIGAVMHAAHGVASDVVRATVYLRDLSPDKVATVRREILAGLDPASPPALTIVGVSAFPDNAMLVMIDGTGQLRSEYPDKSRNRP
jgi:enamine deaminase RidA (YjgF/YER057c/UK114 family)